MASKVKDDEFNEKEAQARFEAALKGALKTPHKPLKEREASEPTSRPRSSQKIDKKRNSPKAGG